MIEPDAIEPTIPVKLAVQVTADHLITRDDGEEDNGISTDTVAVVLLDRGTGWTSEGLQVNRTHCRSFSALRSS